MPAAHLEISGGEALWQEPTAGAVMEPWEVGLEIGWGHVPWPLYKMKITGSSSRGLLRILGCSLQNQPALQFS